MRQRSPLKATIVEAWRSCITDDYCRQRINSERSLQASLWARLNERLPANRRMFIEPHVAVSSENGAVSLLPDLVICNSREVIGVIELKYQPRTTPSYSKDINTLATLAAYRDGISFQNERYRGEAADDRKYSMSQHILFVWADVHESYPMPESPFAHGRDPLKGCYLELHAATLEGRHPEVYERAY